MERNWILQTAETARLQLIASTPTNTLLSWGIETFFATTYNGMASLGIKLRGRLFQGTVIVAYNEGDDYYEIYLLDCSGAKCIGQGLSFDQIGMVIDENVERGKDVEEYRNFCEAERRRLFRGEVC